MKKVLRVLQSCRFFPAPYLYQDSGIDFAKEKFTVDPILDELSDQLVNIKVMLEEYKIKYPLPESPITRTIKTPTQSRIIRNLPSHSEQSFGERFVESIPSPHYPEPKVRVGTLLETLDSFVSLVSYKHLEPCAEPVTVVTAHINHISGLTYLDPYREITIRGKCIWSGRSSMKIHTWIYNENLEEGDDFPVAEATFTTVARSMWPEELPFVVPGIQPANEEERVLEAKARENMQEYEHLVEHILDFVSLEGSEQKSFEEQLFELYPNHRSIESTRYTRSVKIYPGTRNSFGKVVGGVVLKRMSELARLSARMFAEVKPSFISMDDTVFLRPIFVGGSVTYTANVVYAEDFSLVVRVKCEVIRDVNNEIDAVPEGDKELVSVSHFMFSTIPRGHMATNDDEVIEPYRIKKRLFPTTEVEAMLHYEGKRIHNQERNQVLLKEYNSFES